ncbi:MAG: hypothetical protein E7574_01715 [Ruminococcaceae bacterium]|nr:hypothetical protein [Oscillospiraceae bacterium]
MKKKDSSIRSVKFYNIYFPVWVLMLFPLTWLIIIPGNFLVDSLVLLLGMYFLKIEKKSTFYKKYIFLIFIFSFLADVVGGFVMVISLFVGKDSAFFNEYISEQIARNPFDNVYTLIYTFIAVIISGIIIYVLNRFITFRKEECIKTKRFLSLLIAFLTAPYFFLLPTETIYGGQAESFTNHIVWQSYTFAELYVSEDPDVDILKVDEGEHYNNNLVTVLRDSINTADKSKIAEHGEWKYKVVFYRLGKDSDKLDEILIYEKNNELYFEFGDKNYKIKEEYRKELINEIEQVLNPSVEDEGIE